MLHLLRRLRVKASVVVHAAAWQWIDPLQRDFSGVLLQEIHGVFSFNVSVHGQWSSTNLANLDLLVVGRGAGLVYHVQNHLPVVRTLVSPLRINRWGHPWCHL